MFQQYFTDISIQLIDGFISTVLYKDIIENQAEYFDENHIEIIDNTQYLSIRDFSTKFIVLWERFLETNSTASDLINTLHNTICTITGLSFSRGTIEFMIISSMIGNIIKFKFKIPNGDVEVPMIINLNIDQIISDFSEAEIPV